MFCDASPLNPAVIIIAHLQDKLYSYGLLDCLEVPLVMPYMTINFLLKNVFKRIQSFFSEGGPVIVLWQLTVELNCIFFFRCDLDKQMFTQEIYMLCQTQLYAGDCYGVQVYKIEQLLFVLSLSWEVRSLMSIWWVDTWPGTKAWLWLTLNQNSDFISAFQE